MASDFVARTRSTGITSDSAGDYRVPLDESSIRVPAEVLNEAPAIVNDCASVELPTGEATTIPAATSSDVQVFITYWGDDARKTVEQIHESLENDNVEVIVNYMQEKLMSMNVNEWVNSNIEGTPDKLRHFVMVCIDPNYKKEVCRYIDTDRSDDQDKSLQQYIFDMLQSKIIHQGMRNFNFLPVRINGAKFSDLPSVFQSSRTYCWPKDRSNILDRLFCRQRYKQPKLGRPPVPEFRRIR